MRLEIGLGVLEAAQERGLMEKQANRKRRLGVLAAAQERGWQEIAVRLKKIGRAHV